MLDLKNASKLKLIGIVVVALFLIIIGFASAKMFSPNKVVIQVPVTTVYQSAIDTLIADKKRRIKYESVLESEFNIEIKAEKDLHDKTKSQYDKIKTFTDSSRVKWMDSVRTAHGL